MGATEDQSDPVGSATKFLLRASADVDVHEQVMMTYLVYFKKSGDAQRARNSSAQAGWRATLFAVPEEYVLRLTRSRLLTDGLIAAEREQALQISTANHGHWRYVLLEQETRGDAHWERLADAVRRQAAVPSPDVPTQRQAPRSESLPSQASDVAS